MGETMVKVELDDRRIWRRHLDRVVRSQIGMRSHTPTPGPISGHVDNTGPSIDAPDLPPDPPTETNAQEPPLATDGDPGATADEAVAIGDSTSTDGTPTTPRRRWIRITFH